jgi:hypothetical protein
VPFPNKAAADKVFWDLWCSCSIRSLPAEHVAVWELLFGDSCSCHRGKSIERRPDVSYAQFMARIGFVIQANGPNRGNSLGSPSKPK